MNKQQAQEIIKNTFESPFDKVRFTNFVKNLLNRIDEDSFTYQGQFIPDSYKPFISRYIRVGKFNDGENRIDILIVYLNKNTSIEHARTMQRNFIAGYLQGKYGSTNEKNAALVAFVSPDKADWRFSLVKLDYLFKPRKDGIPKAIEEFTPARRWSFLVGENEKSHTAQSRLVKMLANDEHDPTLKEIEQAFDIETVTKEFFLKYRELFLLTKEELDKIVTQASSLRNEFESKGVDTVNFAKKLLGQIIFLYFLQKKGWFGVGRDDDWDTGSKHFLRELFEKKHGDYNNFFNDILEPLFYDALRNDRSHDDGYYSRFNCKIPFLNGGLFDPIGNYNWVHIDIIIPDKLFSNNVKTKEGDIGTGILDVFDRYNFTVKEDEPLEKEVAIDPELLGKSYERFNAIRPDNFAEFKKSLKSGKKGEENKFNKKFGVYYTPREIVHYMCQQSLINYLATELEGKAKKEAIEFFILEGEKYIEHLKTAKEKKEKNANYQGDYKEKEHFIELKKHASEIDNSLSTIKVCDPAVGSGAFPVGMMTEIVKARMFFVETGCLEEIYINSHQEKVKRTPYNFKRDCIEYSLYGVDIDPGAVEIAKLRLWLSLVVDEDNIKNIKPLPNLDYRIMQGNSLISEFMGISFDEDENKNLKQNIDDLGIEIKELDRQIKDKEKQFLRYYNKTKKQDQDLSNKLEELTKRKNDLKKNQTQLIKKLNNPQNEDPEIIDIISEFQKKKNNFLNESNVTKKLQLKNEVDDLLVKIFETKLRTQKPDYFNRLKNIKNKYSVVRNEKQRDELIKQDKEKLNKEFGFDPELAEKQLKEFTIGRKIKPFFLWNLYFSEVFLSGAKSASGGHNKGGFDVVIANPPYKVLTKNNTPINEHEYYIKHYKAIEGSYSKNLFTLFIEHSIKLLKPKANLSYIIPEGLFKTRSYKGCVDLMAKEGNTKLVVTFTDYVFENAITGNLIFLFERGWKGQTSYFQFNSEYELSKIEVKENKVIAKIEKDTVSLKEITTTYKGMVVKDRDTVLFEEKKNNKNDFLLGKNISKWKIISKYYTNYDDLQIIGGTKKLIKHNQVPRILIRRTGNSLCCAYLEKPALTESTLYSCWSNSQKFSNKFLIGLLNSKVLDYYNKILFITNRQGFPQILMTDLEQLPIKQTSTTEQEPFADLVNQILSITKSEDYAENPQKQAKVKALEAEIDQLVYKLYDLTQEEIKIVESEKSKW